VRVLLQRVSAARVWVAERRVAEIGPGVLLLVGVAPGDTPEAAVHLSAKVAHLRIFEDAGGKLNLSLRETGGAALVVSQFTLYADTRKGRRPSFTNAALPEIARPLVDHLAQGLRDLGVPTQMGEFGAHMRVELTNDGPVTILLETEPPA
jgi:D-tyrosyl-tRNA(Tyr) deacylase